MIIATLAHCTQLSLSLQKASRSCWEIWVQINHKDTSRQLPSSATSYILSPPPSPPHLSLTSITYLVPMLILANDSEIPVTYGGLPGLVARPLSWRRRKNAMLEQKDKRHSLSAPAWNSRTNTSTRTPAAFLGSDET